MIGGFVALFMTMALISAAAALWVGLTMPALPVLPCRDPPKRRTIFPHPDLGTGRSHGSFGRRCWISATAGQHPSPKPVRQHGRGGTPGAVLHTNPTDSGTPAGQRPHLNRCRMSVGLALIASGIVLLAIAPLPITLYLAAMVLGCGIGITTPLGFAHLAATTPPERMGRTMGAAELGREVGDAGGPLIVGAIASIASIAAGLGTLGLLITIASVLCTTLVPHRSHQ